MRVLDLFSGTHSVGKVCKELGYECISLDLKDADINCDRLQVPSRSSVIATLVPLRDPCDQVTVTPVTPTLSLAVTSKV